MVLFIHFSGRTSIVETNKQKTYYEVFICLVREQLLLRGNKCLIVLWGVDPFSEKRHIVKG